MSKKHAINFEEKELIEVDLDPSPSSMQTFERMVTRRLSCKPSCRPSPSCRPPCRPSCMCTRPSCRPSCTDNSGSLVKYSSIPVPWYLGFFQDGFSTLLNSKWYWIVTFFCANYIISWLIFGAIWTAVVNGNDQCLVGVTDFQSAFIFAIETQVTIGYGTRYVQGDCSAGIFLVLLQSIVGLFQDSVLLGLIFSKLTGPRNRRKTIVFSDVAVIYLKDGQQCLEIRISDICRSQLVECHVRLFLYWNRLVDSDSNQYEFQQYDLDVGYDTGRDRILLLTPVIVTHVINESSPLFGITEEQLEAMDMELVVILEGIVEKTSFTVQALWSYTRAEVLFGQKFLPMVRRQGGRWEIDFSRMNSTTTA